VILLAVKAELRSSVFLRQPGRGGKKRAIYKSKRPELPPDNRSGLGREVSV